MGRAQRHLCISRFQRKVWNTRVFRLFVRGIFLVENLSSLYKFEQLPKLEKGDQWAVRLFPWRFQKEDEQRWKTSMLTAYWPGPHWDTRTRVTEESKPQVWGETPWNTDSPGLTDAPLSHTLPASSANPIPLMLQRAWRHTSPRASLSGNWSRMATRRGTAPWRSNSCCSLAEGESEHWILNQFIEPTLFIYFYMGLVLNKFPHIDRFFVSQTFSRNPVGCFLFSIKGMNKIVFSISVLFN